MKVGRLYWLLAIAILVSYFALVGPGTGHRLELSDDESEQFGSDLEKSTSYLPVPANEDLETSHLAPSMWSSPTWHHVPDADLLRAVAQLNSAHLWLSLQPSSLTSNDSGLLSLWETSPYLDSPASLMSLLQDISIGEGVAVDVEMWPALDLFWSDLETEPVVPGVGTLRPFTGGISGYRLSPSGPVGTARPFQPGGEGHPKLDNPGNNDARIDTPEPSSLALLALALICFAWMRRAVACQNS